MVIGRIDSCLLCQSQSHTKRIRGTLTISNQPRHFPSITYGIITRSDFENVKRVRPSIFVAAGSREALVEEGLVGRKTLLIHHMVGVAILTLFRGNAIEIGSRHDVKNGVRHLHQGLIEVLLEGFVFVAQPTVRLVVPLEVHVGLDRIDGRFLS